MKNELNEGRKYGGGPVPNWMGKEDLSERLAAIQNKFNISKWARWPI